VVDTAVRLLATPWLLVSNRPRLAFQRQKPSKLVCPHRYLFVVPLVGDELGQGAYACLILWRHRTSWGEGTSILKAAAAYIQ